VCDTVGGGRLEARVDGDGVKDGLGEEADDEDVRSLAPALAASSPAWLVAFESVLDERANQLFVAAIACLTAWRPVSRTPLPEPAVSPGRSSSVFSPDDAAPAAVEAAPAAVEAAAALAELAPVAARKPALGVFELLGFPISSAGNGTGAWLDPAPPRAPEPGLPGLLALPDPDASAEGAEDAGEEEEASVTAPSGAESAPFWLAALAADRDAPDPDDPDRDVSDRVRDEDMTPLSSIDSAVPASGSTS
jgi:hypothetical protein